MKDNIIRTSDKYWLDKVLKAYKEKKTFEFIDDAEIGIRKQDLKSAILLINRVKHLGTPWKIIGQILTGFGLSGIGLTLVLLAVFDPEPTSKLWILLSGGVVFIMTGGVSILRALGQKWKIVAKKGKQVIIVEPED